MGENGAPISRHQLKPVVCPGCSCQIFNLVPRALIFRDRLRPKDVTVQQAVGYTCAKCGAELDLNKLPQEIL